MGKINRFYNPVPQQYVSQFIPENLQLMQNALNVKQNQYDTTQKQLDLYEDDLLKQQALSGTDKDVYLKGLRDDFSKTTEGFLGKDLGDPEVAREVGKFLRTFKQDPRISKLNEGIALKKKYDELIEKYKSEKDAHAYASENELEWLNAWNEYTNQTSKDPKFAADLLRGKENITRGIDIRAEEKKYFDDARIRGGETLLKTLEGTYYEKGVKGISKSQIDELANYGFNQFQQSNAAQQLRRRYDQQVANGYTPKAMSTRDSKGNIIEGKELSREEYVLDDFLRTGYEGVGQTVDYTGRAGALNTDRKRKEESAQAYYDKGTTRGIGADYVTIQDLNSDIKRLETSDNIDDKRKARDLKNQKYKLEEKFNSTLSEDKKQVMNMTADEAYSNIINSDKSNELKVNSLTNILEKALSNGDYPYSIAPEAMAVQILNNNEKQFLIEGQDNADDAIRSIISKQKGFDYKDIKKQKDEYLTKQYIEETNDILLDAGSGGKKTRGNVASALSSYISGNINYTIEGVDEEDPEKRSEKINEAISDIDPNSIKVRDSSTGPIIVFKTKGTDGEPEVIKLKHKSTGSGVSEDRAITELYKQLTGGDERMFGKIMTSHKYANLSPTEPGVEYNAINETIALDDPFVNKFILDANAQDVQYKNEDGKVRLYLDGERQYFRNDEGEELNITSIPELIEVMKYTTIERLNSEK